MCIVQNIPSCSILFIFSLMCRRRRCRRRSSTWVFAYVCPENEHVCSSHNTYSLSFSPSLRNLKKKPSLHLYFSETFLRAVGNSIFQCVFRDHTVRTETLLLWNREREQSREKENDVKYIQTYVRFATVISDRFSTGWNKNASSAEFDSIVLTFYWCIWSIR